MWSEESRKKISESRKGKKWPEEVKKKMSESHKRYFQNGGTAWNQGMKMSVEHRQKLSEAHKGQKGFWLGKKRPPFKSLENYGKLKGEKHPRWKGDEVGYGALHDWVRKYLGEPDTCEHCGRSNLSGHLIHWANKSHEYKRDLNDWLRLCVPCHSQFDSN